jgi:hypothetical protein
MCTVLLPPGVNLLAVKYIVSYIIYRIIYIISLWLKSTYIDLGQKCVPPPRRNPPTLHNWVVMAWHLKDIRVYDVTWRNVRLSVHSSRVLSFLSPFVRLRPCFRTRELQNNLFPHARRLCLKCDGTCAETRIRLSAKRTSPFKAAEVSVQSTTGSRGVRVKGNNAGYNMFRGSVKGTGYPLHSPVSPLLPLPCVTVCHHLHASTTVGTRINS